MPSVGPQSGGQIMEKSPASPSDAIGRTSVWGTGNGEVPSFSLFLVRYATLLHYALRTESSQQNVVLATCAVSRTMRSPTQSARI